MVGIGLGFVKGGGAAAAEPWYTNLTNVPTSSGSATVTADTLAHTKGAYTEIIASNGADTSCLLIHVSDVNALATDTSTLLDIAVGASGSESVVIPDLAVGGSPGGVVQNYIIVPIQISSGARLSARIQSVVTGGKTASVKLQTFAWGAASILPTSVDVLGTSTATSAGTNVTTSYTEIVASTSTAYKAIAVLPSFSSASGASNVGETLTVAVGASSSEVDIHQITYSESTSEYVTVGSNAILVTDVDIPAGSRISAKVSASDIWACVIGIPA